MGSILFRDLAFRGVFTLRISQRSTHGDNATGGPPGAVAAYLTGPLLVALIALSVLATPRHCRAEGQTPYRFVLGNGLTVIGCETPSSPTVAINAFLRLSVLNERADTVGIRQLTQLWLPDRPQTNGLPSLADQLDDIGARFDTSTEADFVKVTLLASDNDFRRALQILERALYSDDFDLKAFEAHRMVALRLVAARLELPLPAIDDALVAALYPGSAQSRSPLGEARVLSRLTPAQVITFHRTHYLPGVTVLSVAGGVSQEQVKTQTTQTFAPVLPGPAPVAETAAASQPKSGAVRVKVDTDSAAVAIGGRAPALADPDYPAAALAVSMLGSGLDSILYHALREKQTLVYSVDAELTPSTVAGKAVAYALCDPQAVGKVTDIMLSEIRKLADTPPEAAQLERRKAYLAGTYLMGRQRNSDVAHYLGLMEALAPGEGATLDATLISKIRAVSAADVSRAVKQLFGSPVVVTVGADESPGRRPEGGSAQLPAIGRPSVLFGLYR